MLYHVTHVDVHETSSHTWPWKYSSMMVEVLLEIGASKEVIKVTKDSLEVSIKGKLPGRSCDAGPYLIPFDRDMPRTKGTFILQKWSPKWECYTDSDGEVAEGDRFKVVECNSQEVMQLASAMDTCDYFLFILECQQNKITLPNSIQTN